MDDFSVEVKPIEVDGAIVLKPNGIIDSGTTSILENHFESAMANQRYRVVLDLATTDFISSSGFGLILGTVGQLREHGGDLILMNVPDQVADVFVTLTVDDYFHKINSLEDLKVTQQR